MAQRQQHRHQRRQQQPRPCASGPWRMMMGKKRCRGRTGTPLLFLFFKKKRTKEKESRGRCSEVIQPILCRCRQEVLVFWAPSTARAVLSWASSRILCSVPPWYADVRIPCDVVHHSHPILPLPLGTVFVGLQCRSEIVLVAVTGSPSSGFQDIIFKVWDLYHHLGSGLILDFWSCLSDFSFVVFEWLLPTLCPCTPGVEQAIAGDK